MCVVYSISMITQYNDFFVITLKYFVVILANSSRSVKRSEECKYKIGNFTQKIETFIPLVYVIQLPTGW